MPAVQTSRRIDGRTDAVWDVLKRGDVFAAHPDIGIETLPSGDDGRKRRWTVRMNGSTVVWTQREFAEPGPRLRFEQVEGDFEALSGTWSLDSAPEGTRVTLDVEFDLGVDGLAPLLEPMWRQSLQVYARTLLSALAGSVTGSAGGE